MHVSCCLPFKSWGRVIQNRNHVGDLDSPAGSSPRSSGFCSPAHRLGMFFCAAPWRRCLGWSGTHPRGSNPPAGYWPRSARKQRGGGADSKTQRAVGHTVARQGRFLEIAMTRRPVSHHERQSTPKIAVATLSAACSSAEMTPENTNSIRLRKSGVSRPESGAAREPE